MSFPDFYKRNKMINMFSGNNVHFRMLCIKVVLRGKAGEGEIAVLSVSVI